MERKNRTTKFDDNASSTDVATMFEMARSTVDTIHKELGVDAKHRTALQKEMASLKGSIKKAQEAIEIIRPILLTYCEVLLERNSNEDIEARAQNKRKRT
jgi:hypothetical protein